MVTTYYKVNGEILNIHEFESKHPNESNMLPLRNEFIFIKTTLDEMTNKNYKIIIDVDSPNLQVYLD